MNNKSLFITITLVAILFITQHATASDYLEDAQQYLQEGKTKAAIIQLKNHLKKHPDDAEARYLLGTSYIKTGDIAQAGKEITRAYGLNQDNSKIVLAYAQLLLLKKEFTKVNTVLANEMADKDEEEQRQIYRAYAYLGQGNLSEAKHLFTQIVQSGDNIQSFNGLAKIAIIEKQISAGSQWVDKALALNPDNKDALQLKAKLANLDKRYADALTIYDKLIQQQPNNLTYHIERASTHLALRNLNEAENDIRFVLDSIENQPQALYLLAQVKLQEHNYKEAQDAARQVLNYLPRHYPSMLILGIANLGLGHFNQAEKFLTQYLSSYPDNIAVQNLLANVYIAQRKGQQALLILESIDEKQTQNDPKLLMSLGSAYLLTDEYDKGIAYLNRANQLAPDNSAIQSRLIAAQAKVGDIDNVIIGLEKLADSNQGNKKTNYLLIVSLMQKKNLVKAEEKLNQLLKEMPEDTDFLVLLAILEKMKGHPEKAESAYFKAIEIDERFIPAYTGLAKLALEQNDLNKANDYYKKVIQINPDHIKAYIVLAGIAEKENKPQEVEKNLLTAFDKASANEKTQLELAVLLSKWYTQQNQKEKILPLARKLERQYPDNTNVLAFVARAQIINQQETNAEKTLNEIIKKNPGDVQHRLLLVNLLSTKEGGEEAVIRILDEVIELEPDDTKPQLVKAALLANQGKYSQALDVAEHLTINFPQQALGMQLKGDIYLKQEEFEKALKAYKTAYDVKPDNKLLFAIVDLQNYLGNESDSIKILKDVLVKDNQNLKIHFKLATMYQANEKYDKAINQYKIMLDLDENNSFALNNLAWIYLTENNPLALVMAKKAYENAAETAAIADTYGYIMLKQGDMQEGLRILERSVKLDPEDYDIQYHLAEGYILQGDTQKAKNTLEKIINSEKTFSEKQNAIKLLEKIHN